MNSNLKSFSLLLLLGLSSVTSGFAGIINVPASQSTIQAGLNAAVSGDTVLVQPGVYTENIVWPAVTGIRLISTGDSTNTFIDGNSSDRVLLISGTAHSTTTLIKGFTIRNGNLSTAWYGGGIYINNAGSPLIENTAITGNTVTGGRTYGAGVSIVNSSPVFRNSSISMNRAATPSCNYHYGGGVYASGSSPVFINVIIVDNIQQTCSRTYGTGMYFSNSIVELTNVLIANNIMEGTNFRNGGGIYCSSSYVTLTNVTIAGNRHASGTSINGTGINVTHSGVDGGTITATNLISWNNQAGNEFQGPADSIFVSYSDIRGGWTGTGNIDLDPLFMSATNFNLQASSPCVDAGTSVTAPLTDIEGKLRDASPDMGAYEYVDPATGINSVEKEHHVLIYPNPAADYITVQNNSKEPVIYIALYDLTGREIANYKIEHLQQRADVSSLTSGVYVYRCTNWQGKVLFSGKLTILSNLGR